MFSKDIGTLCFSVSAFLTQHEHTYLLMCWEQQTQSGFRRSLSPTMHPRHLQEITQHLMVFIKSYNTDNDYAATPTFIRRRSLIWNHVDNRAIFLSTRAAVWEYENQPIKRNTVSRNEGDGEKYQIVKYHCTKPRTWNHIKMRTDIKRATVLSRSQSWTQPGWLGPQRSPCTDCLLTWDRR